MKQWRLDDEQVVYPTFELIRKNQVLLRDERPAFGNICVHKGFAPTVDDTPQNGNPEDLPKAARDWPTFNFIIYHSCIAPVLFYNPEPLSNLLSAHPVLREGVPDIRWTTRFGQLSRNLNNVYAEVGSTIPKKFGAIPADFESRMPASLKSLLEFPGFASDNISKMKQRYLAEGSVPDHSRLGWIRSRV